MQNLIKSIKKTPNVFVILMLFFSSCQKNQEELSPSAIDLNGNARIEGEYRVINNPLLCTLPTTNKVAVTNEQDGYQIAFTPNSSLKAMTLTKVTLDKDSTNNFILKQGGVIIGSFKVQKYTEFEGINIVNREGAVLSLRYTDSPSKLYVDFMGKK
jgi:hypothetical protein